MRRACARSPPEGLGIVLDIVPNHMGTGDENRWWADEARRAEVFDYDPADGWYRRFFDIDDLAAVRVEREEVFALVHDKVLELVRDGVLDGLRVDHPDGLADPAGYLRRLRDAGAERVWVEKILHPGEPLRDWPVEGTVGYEFLNDAAALYVDPAGESALASLPSADRPFAEVALRGAARAGDDDVRTRGGPAPFSPRRRRHRRRPLLVARVPHLRRAVVGRVSTTSIVRRSPRRASRGRSPRHCCWSGRGRTWTSSSFASSRRRLP